VGPLGSPFFRNVAADGRRLGEKIVIGHAGDEIAYPGRRGLRSEIAGRQSRV
jgi:hypothetical protein